MGGTGAWLGLATGGGVGVDLRDFYIYIEKTLGILSYSHTIYIYDCKYLVDISIFLQSHM